MLLLFEFFVIKNFLGYWHFGDIRLLWKRWCFWWGYLSFGDGPLFINYVMGFIHKMGLIIMFLDMVFFSVFIGSVQEFKSVSLDNKIWCFRFVRIIGLLLIFYLVLFSFRLFFGQVILWILKYFLDFQMYPRPFSIIIFNQLFFWFLSFWTC